MNPVASPVPDWTGATVVILASGESLTLAQCMRVRDWRAEAPRLRKAIAINTTFRRAPWADMLYACDHPWWRKHADEVRETFEGECWSQDPVANRDQGTRWIMSVPVAGLSKRPGVIHQGGNGAYQAMNLAYHAGVRRIVALGLDLRGEHWHGPHEGLSNPSPWLFERWKGEFELLAKDFAAAGVTVVNASPGTALRAFPQQELEEALACSP